MKTRPATQSEMIAEADKHQRLGVRVIFRHFTMEMLCPHAANGVSHRSHSRSKPVISDGRVFVRHHGELVGVTATHFSYVDETDGRERCFLADWRIKSEYLPQL